MGLTIGMMSDFNPTSYTVTPEYKERFDRMEKALNELRFKFARQELCLYDVEVIASEALKED
jgi:hypothetical protein